MGNYRLSVKRRKYSHISLIPEKTLNICTWHIYIPLLYTYVKEMMKPHTGVADMQRTTSV